MVTKPLLYTQQTSIHPSIPLCHFKELACMACPSAPTEEVCCAVYSGRSATWYHCGRAEWRGSVLGLNLVPFQNPWARAAVSQGATVRRQDIPAQDEEMSVTTCYAKPWAEEGKRREGGMDGKDSFDRDCVFASAPAEGIMRMHLCVHQCVCFVIVCL